jgi:dCTP deaminase
MLLSDRDIAAALKAGRLGLEPFEPELVQPSSVDVRLDRRFRVFNNQKYTHIDPSKRPDRPGGRGRGRALRASSR